MDDMTTPEPEEAQSAVPVVVPEPEMSAADPAAGPSATLSETHVSEPLPAAPVWNEPPPDPGLWSNPGSGAAPGSPAGPPAGPGQIPPGHPQPTWGTPPQPAAKPARVRKPIGTARIMVAVGALVSIAVGGGVGALIVHGKTRHNQQVTAQALASAAARPQPQTAGVRSDGSHYGPLFAYLLPIPAGYDLGPSDADYGNNSYLTKDQINSDLDGLLSGVPQSDLSSAKGSLADVSLKDMAIRTYADPSTTLVVQIALIQSDVADATENARLFQSTISDADVFRQGPPVPGYGQATCVLPPGLGSDTIDSMICMASSGDVLVRVNAYGTAPLDMTTITQLVSRQLDLLKTNQTIG